MIAYAQTQKMPRTVLVYSIIGLILKLCILTLPFMILGEGEFMSVFKFIFLLLGVCAVLYCWVDYENTSFVLEDGKITINRGIFTKRSKTLPFDKVQNVNVFSGPITTLMGISGIKIWTASPGQRVVSNNGITGSLADGFLYLFTQDAHWLRDEIFK